jgi:hypothetical protein
MRGFHQDAEVPMNARAAPMRKCTFAVLAVNQATVLEVAQRQPDCDTADTESTTELVLARNGKRGGIIPAKNLLCYGSD